MTGRRRRAARFLRAVVLDLEPLKLSNGYRWLFVGQSGALLARNLLVVAVPYQVFVLTRSSLLVGLIGLVQIIPLQIGALLGGTAADAFDRRGLLIVVEVFMAATSLGLALNTVSSPHLWAIFVLIALNAAISGFESPARVAMIPNLVPAAQLPSAFALNQSLQQTLTTVGPAVGGVLMAQVGIGIAYWLSMAAGIFTALALIPMGPQRPEDASGRISLRATLEGWRYLRGKPLLQQVMVIDVNAMVFGMPRALFPYLGTVVFGGDAATVGLLHAAPGAGALVGALTTGWVSKVQRQGRAIIYAVLAWGLAITAFGLTSNLMLALVLLAIAGAGDVISNVFRNTILHTVVPDALRGRLTSFKVALSSGAPRLGDGEAGAVAALATPKISVVSGGLASMAGAVLIAWRGRDLWDQIAPGPSAVEDAALAVPAGVVPPAERPADA